MKKNRLLFLSLFLVLFALVFSLFNFNVQANSSSVSIEGVQVRNTGVVGIRFVGKVDDNYQGNPSGYGILLAYGHANTDQIVLNGTFGGKSILDGRVTELDETNNYYVNLINIPENMYGQEVTARAYFIENGEVVYSSESKITSLGEATLTLASLGEMTEGDNVELVFNALKTNYKKYHIDANGNVFITNPVYETNLETLEKEFVSDWNTKFGTTWTEISYFPLQANAIYIDENTKLEDTSLDCSQTNLYKFFNETGTSTKWGWLLNYLKSIGTVHPKRQINAIQNGGTAENDGYSNGVMALQSFKHLSASIVNFFNGGCCRDTVDILFDDVNKYLTVDQYNNQILSNDPALVYIGNSIQLENLTPANGYSFDGYVLGENIYNEEYDVTANTQILVPSYSIVNYTIKYYNGTEELTSLSSTYTINDSVTLPTPSINGFVSWHENNDFSDDPITIIEEGTFGDKIYYAKVTNETTVSITLDYMDPMTKEEIWNEFRSDVATYGQHANSSKFLTDTEIQSYGTDYVPLKAALDNSPTGFAPKWSWLFNAIADAHSNISTSYCDSVRSMSTGTYTAEGIYVFCQEMKGFYGVKKAENYGNVVMYDWSTDSASEYDAVYSSSKTANNTLNLIVGSSLADPTFSRDGYTFEGWYTSSNYEESAKVIVVPNTSCTLYAKWYKITSQDLVNATSDELDDYFNSLDVVTSDLELSNTNESYGTSLSYSSSDPSIIANDGTFNRPYQATTVTYSVTISYGEHTKTNEYEISVAGFKTLTNIASTYIGGDSTTYLSLSSNLFAICDIITCGFAYPAADGTFTADTVNSLNYTYYLPRISQYVISQAHAQGTYVVLSIAGMSEYDSALETICSSDSLIETFVSNIIEIINEYGFDGVDIDWEIPSNGTLFTKLMTKLYTAVKANNSNHLVTAAIGGGADQPAYYDLSNSYKYIDYINMMTYNMASSYGYHHTALYASSSYHNSTNKAAKTLSTCSIDESVEIYKNYGVPASKLIIGSGFYGMVQTRTTTSGTWTDAGTTVSYIDIKNNYLTDTTNYTSYYDDICQVPYLISTDRLTFISYENATSISAKCNYVKNNSLGGIFSWHYGLDDGDLLNSFKVGLSK